MTPPNPMHPTQKPLPPLLTAVLVFVFSLLGGAQAPPVHAQSDGTALPESRIDSLLLQGKALLSKGVNAGSVDTIRQARARFKQAIGSPEHQNLAHYYAALADYRLATQLPDDEEDRRTQTLTDAIDHLKTATDQAPTMADAWALLAGCYGQMIGLHPMRGMDLGPKSNDAMQKAQTLAPNNPRVWIISGTQDYFAPGPFGGDKATALKKFRKAARLAEQETVDNPLRPSWGHAEAYTWIGIAHMSAERYAKARSAFEKVLDLSPDYGWVKHALLPKLQKKQS